MSHLLEIILDGLSAGTLKYLMAEFATPSAVDSVVGVRTLVRRLTLPIETRLLSFHPKKSLLLI